MIRVTWSEERHNPIWPELEKVLKGHGLSNYPIFLHPETRQLFCGAVLGAETPRVSVLHSPSVMPWRARVVPVACS